MKKIVIFGLEQFADQIDTNLSKEGRPPVAFTVDEKYIQGRTEYRGRPLVPFERLNDYYPPEEYALIICLGHKKMNMFRAEKFKKAKEMGYEIEGYRHPSAIVQADEIGVGNIFMEGSVVGQGVKIGDGNVFWPCSHVAHHTTVGNFNFFTISTAVAGNIIIHDFCFFGANCTVKNSIEIGTGTLVGAGAYVANSTEEYSVYVPPRSYKLEGKNSLEMGI